MFDKIKSYYDSGLWNKTRVRNMVLKGIITVKEFELIIGKGFEE